MALKFNEHQNGWSDNEELTHTTRNPLKIFTSIVSYVHKYHFLTCSIITAHTNSISDDLYTGECDTENQ